MGQRTQVLVIKENNKKERKVTFLHHQWGFGRMMYMALMDMFFQDYYKDTFKRGYSFLTPAAVATSSRFYDCTDEVPTKVLEDVDPDNFASIVRVFDYGDNNNGGLVIYIKEKKKVYDTSNFKIGFLLGWEDTYCKCEDGEEINVGHDENAFLRWLTPEEYGKMNGGSDYSDEKFVRIFMRFCRYFGIKFFKNISTPEENLADITKLRNEFKEYEETFENKRSIPYGYNYEGETYLLAARYYDGTEGEFEIYSYFLIKSFENPIKDIKTDGWDKGWGKITDKALKIISKNTGMSKNKILSGGILKPDWRIVAWGENAVKTYDTLRFIEQNHIEGVILKNNINVY